MIDNVHDRETMPTFPAADEVDDDAPTLRRMPTAAELAQDEEQ